MRQSKPLVILAIISSATLVTVVGIFSFTTTRYALSNDKRELLELRFFHGLSWDEVAAHFMARGEKVTISTLRKRGQRAIDELRKNFLKILQN